MTPQLRTFTLSDDSGNPTHSLCRGHVTLEVFQRAFTAEGWSGDNIEKIAHEWWARSARDEAKKVQGRTLEWWIKTEKGCPGALPMTVTVW